VGPHSKPAISKSEGKREGKKIKELRQKLDQSMGIFDSQRTRTQGKRFGAKTKGTKDCGYCKHDSHFIGGEGTENVTGRTKTSGGERQQDKQSQKIRKLSKNSTYVKGKSGPMIDRVTWGCIKRSIYRKSCEVLRISTNLWEVSMHRKDGEK